MGGWGLAAYFKAGCRHGLMLIPILVIICLALLGKIGESFGIPQLFTDEVDPLSVHPEVPLIFRLLSSAQFATQVYAVALFGLVWTLIILMETERDVREEGSAGRPRTRSLLAAITLATMLTSSLSLGASLRTAMVSDPAVQGIRQIPLLPVLGTVTGLVLSFIGTSIALKCADWRGWRPLPSVILFSVAVLITLMYVPVALPAKAIFILAGWMVLAYTSFYLLPSLYRFPGLLLLAVIVGLTNSVGEKYTLPSMESLYDNRTVLVTPAAPPAPDMRSASVACSGTGPSTATGKGLIQPIRGLQAWLDRQVGQMPVGANKPKLVVIAASGGGYRATFWTALLLDALFEHDTPGGSLEGLERSIKLLTGASGGMVASSYLVASTVLTKSQSHTRDGSLAKLIEHDIGQAQARANRGIPNPIIGSRDSLSSIVRELVKYDMPGVFWPFRRLHDRGRELENHWGLIESVTFAKMLAGERDGWLPHIIFSPVLVETGQPLLISNLDLTNLTRGAKEALEFFKVFPQLQQEFRLSTAARMNATFPYVSPAVQLPTIPSRRVVDAAYYDNYGMAMSIAYLQQDDVMNWIKECTGGMFLIQVRAFRAVDLVAESPATAQAVAHFGRFDWIAAPLQGAITARDTTMRYRNDHELTLLRRIYGDAFLQPILLEPQSSELATMTWVITQREFERVRDDVAAVMNGPEVARLKALWHDRRY